MGKLTIIDHPLIQHKVTMLRDKNTGAKEFRELAGELAALLCYEASRGLTAFETDVETPVCRAKGMLIKEKLGVVPILRAGLGMAGGVLSLLPAAKVGHLGMYRDPGTLRPVTYYSKLPKDVAERRVYVVDPMLATGGTASAAIAHLKEQGVSTISLLCLIAAPEGVGRVLADHPDVDIYAAAHDSRLNEHGYIMPGLGDAGDRLFGTK